MFQPKRSDGRSVWRVIYDHIVSASPEIGTIFLHADLRALLLFIEQKNYYQIVATASRHLENEHHRTLVSVRTIGYRFTAGTEQIDKGRGYRRRASKALARSSNIMKTTDYEIMTADERTWADRHHNAVVALIHIAKQHDEKLIAMDRDLRAVREATMKSAIYQETSDERIAELERSRVADQARIEELERAMIEKATR